MCRHMEFWEKHYFRHPTSVEGLNSSIVFLSCFLQRLALAGKSMINSCSRGEISQQGSLNLTVATALSFYSDSGHVKTSCKWLNHIHTFKTFAFELKESDRVLAVYYKTTNKHTRRAARWLVHLIHVIPKENEQCVSAYLMFIKLRSYMSMRSLRYHSNSEIKLCFSMFWGKCFHSTFVCMYIYIFP